MITRYFVILYNHSKFLCICPFKQLYVGTHSTLDTCSYKIFLNTITDSFTFQTVDLSS